MTKDEEEIPKELLVDRETVLKMSRVPRETKKEFVKLANEKFEGDYGMTLMFCFDQMLEYQQMKYSLFNGLLYPKEQSPASQEEKKPVKKMLDGTVKGGNN